MAANSRSEHAALAICQSRPRPRRLLLALLGLSWARAGLAARSGAPTPLLQRVPNGARHFLAGSISAAGGVTMLAPVEVIRLNLIAGGKGGMSALAGGSWWRGNGFEVMAAAPRVGITMAAFSLYKRTLGSTLYRDREGDLPRGAVFVAGAIAGATATLCTHPLDVVRTRIAVEGLSIGRLAGRVATLRAGEAFWAGNIYLLLYLYLYLYLYIYI